MASHIFTRWSAPLTPEDRLVQIQKICLDKHWCRLLANRWKVSLMTVRRWTAAGLLGEVHRKSVMQVQLSSMAVFEFEKRYADILSVGEPVFNGTQAAKRYGITLRTLQNWVNKHQFPVPERVPTSKMLRWRLSQLERWEAMYGIIPAAKYLTISQ